jgi:1-acyl-sn-glycerol-3-phosphate acyltransferase
MSAESYSIPYPRKIFARGLTRTIGRILLPLLFDVHVTGKENFPKQGPLLIVGNHTAAMEVVLLYLLTPWQVEYLSSADIPPERIIAVLSDLIGVIDLHRGHFDREALRKALDVLKQNGVIGLFPEGGIWQKGEKKPQKGVAWLSYRGNAPVLPIGFSDTRGMLNEALKLRRPTIKMNIGEPLPAAEHTGDISRKVFFETYAARVMDAVNELVPPEDLVQMPKITDESFTLELAMSDGKGQKQDIPEELNIQHARELAKFLHRPAILKIFRRNLDMDIQALESLHTRPGSLQVSQAIAPILAYLKNENPYMLTYRFGPREGKAMQKGLEELSSLADWAAQHNHHLQIRPIRRYYSVPDKEHIVQIEQGIFDQWM